MGLTRRALLGTSASIALAGCLGGGGTTTESDDGGADSTPTEATAAETETETATDTRTPAEQADASATVQVRSHPDHGDILAGPDGMTLYMFDQDTKGDPTSTCYDSCADAWPPLTVTDEPTAGEAVSAQLETFERDDGETQVMAGGWPLYYFANDDAPGDANGQGAGGVWWVLGPAAEPIRPAQTATVTETASPTPTVTDEPY